MSIEANYFEFQSNIQRLRKFGEPMNKALRERVMQSERHMPSLLLLWLKALQDQEQEKLRFISVLNAL
jgi:hypothetical protein